MQEFYKLCICIQDHKTCTRVRLIGGFSVFSSDGKRQVTPLCPPTDCKPGDRVVIQGYEHETAGGIDRFNP